MDHKYCLFSRKIILESKQNIFIGKMLTFLEGIIFHIFGVFFLKKSTSFTPIFHNFTYFLSDSKKNKNLGILNLNIRESFNHYLF